MGPQSARSYPGRRVVKPAPPKAQRAKQEIDYGRRGKGYVFGAFRPQGRPSPKPTRAAPLRTGSISSAQSSAGSTLGSNGSTRWWTISTSTAHRCPLVRACPPALGVRVPAQVCRLPEPDRAVVEDPALAGIEGPPLRGLARDRGGCPARHRVLERAQAPLPVGPQTAAPHRAPPWGRPRAKSLSNLADAPLRSSPTLPTPLYIGRRRAPKSIGMLRAGASGRSPIKSRTV